jgi:hypothetical protein
MHIFFLIVLVISDYFQLSKLEVLPFQNYFLKKLICCECGCLFVDKYAGHSFGKLIHLNMSGYEKLYMEPAIPTSIFITTRKLYNWLYVEVEWL